MKRLQEKVKDIVDVRTFPGISDYTGDPESVLSAYCFTDSTSALMAKWLDAAGRITENSGGALALAGYRGVGKSHFLAALGAVLSKPDLRSRVQDSHVSASALSLMRRRYPVVRVRRGLKGTLLEELFDGVVAEFGEETQFPLDSATELLAAAAERVGDLPLIVIVDTAMERTSRVTRDDGPVLGELAEAAKGRNVMLCLALDDDISGADGTNAAIARTYSIDFLDQEHLYKVVNTHVFPKNSGVEPVIGDIYEFFRSVVPNFRWSSQKFSLLYPLHPGILEVAPYVRLFVQDFALLGFASEAGKRILGRPANSLIAFDEVFDAAEASLRKMADLEDAFAAYDKLNSEVVAKIPVIQRLQAKLILKALLLLSLDGRGATAEDICAAMLIYDEADPPKAADGVKGIIEQFSAALPDDIAVRQFGGEDVYYSFRVSSKDDLNVALQEAVEGLGSEVVPATLRRMMQDRYSDFSVSDTAGAGRCMMDCPIQWRGSIRRGSVTLIESGGANPASPARDEFLDWEAMITFDPDGSPGDAEGQTARVLWRAGELRADEVETIARYHALQFDTGLIEKFGTDIRPSAHAHRVAVEKIFDRVMLESGKLTIDGFDYNFSEPAKSARTLSDLFSVMLEPLFETRFPQHPVFGDRLGMSEVSNLVMDFYVGSKRNLDEAQSLAEAFAEPLGLTQQGEKGLEPAPLEDLEKLDTVSAVLALCSSGGSEVVPLGDIYRELRQPPFGLTREAQHLILASLVAERRIEFVTSQGDRIGARSLDLRIVWDDIVGVMGTASSEVSSELLVRWARILSGDDKVKSISDNKDRSLVMNGASAFLEEWDRLAVLSRFDEVSEVYINTREWARASKVKDTLGAAADALREAVANPSDLEHALSTIAHIFSDSEAEYAKSLDAAAELGHFLDAAEEYQRVSSYIAAAEFSDDTEIEKVRTALIASLDMALLEPSETRNREVGYLWERFQRAYSENFVTRHDSVMRSHDLQEKFDEICRSDVWREYQELSDLPIFSRAGARTAATLTKRLEELDCKFEVRRAIAEQPTCICSFRLGSEPEWRDLPSELWGTVSRALERFRVFLARPHNPVLPALGAIAEGAPNSEKAVAARELIEMFESDEPIPRFSMDQVLVLRSVILELGLGTEAAADPSAESPFHLLDGLDAETIVEDAVIVEI